MLLLIVWKISLLRALASGRWLLLGGPRPRSASSSRQQARGGDSCHRNALATNFHSSLVRLIVTIFVFLHSVLLLPASNQVSRCTVLARET